MSFPTSSLKVWCHTCERYVPFECLEIVVESMSKLRDQIHYLCPLCENPLLVKDILDELGEKP